MSRIRLILLSLLAVFAVSAVASASASAHRFIGSECFKPAIPNNANLKWSTQVKCEKAMPKMGEAMEPWEAEPLAVPAKVEGMSGKSVLKSEVMGVKVFITCEEDTFTGELEAAGASKGEVTFTKCAVLNEKGKQISSCTVKQPIEFKFKDQLVGALGAVEDEFSPAVAGTPFVTITIEGSPCALAGPYEVKGTQKCELPEAGVLKEKHEIVCTEAGSSLKLGVEKATFESTETVKLKSGKNWGSE